MTSDGNDLAPESVDPEAEVDSDPVPAGRAVRTVSEEVAEASFINKDKKTVRSGTGHRIYSFVNAATMTSVIYSI